MRILAVSGSRADYGLLAGPMKAIAAVAGLDLRLALTGAHLEEGFGDARGAVAADGFRIDAEIPAGLTDSSPRSIAEATGRVTSGVARALAEIAPDIVLVLGDRYEILGAVTAAALMEIPVAHVHGGEATVGAIDDCLRNAITKLSHLHFAAAEPYRLRLIQMGEMPERVFTVGAPGVERALATPPSTLDELWGRVGRELPSPFVLVTYHPETAGRPDPAADIRELLAALDDADIGGILFTGVNADARRDEVADAIAAFVSARPGRAALVETLGQRLYWTAAAACAAVVGNSSSGIIEAPALKVPTVNIGSRQDGRLRAPSVLDCAPRCADISAALGRALRRDVPLAGETPYRGDGTSGRIAAILAATHPAALVPKPFRDLPAGVLAA